MANILLQTVYDLNRQIEELKGEYSTILESLLGNPDMGKIKFDIVMDILTSASGAYGSIEDRINISEENIKYITNDIARDIRPGITDIETVIADAQGEYNSLKEAIDNAKE